MAKQWAKQFYNSRQWKDCRRYVLRRDNYTCADCYSRAEEVHHIIELSPDNIHDITIALNPDNLISLCSKCHKKRTKGSIDVGEEYYFDENGYIVHTPPV